ncbi:MAG TPA: hypothetical protein VF773_12730 [Verrucomicrobiae bacterium]
MKRRAFTFFQLAAGACDTGTGILLLVAPQLALKLMGVAQTPSDPIFISFIGAFVFSVGLTYLVFSRIPASESRLGAARAAWLITGMQRLCVGVFVLVAMVAGRLDLAWCSITVADLSIGGIQLLGLRKRWIEATL